MSRKSRPISYGKLLLKMGQDFLDIQNIEDTIPCPNHRKYVLLRSWFYTVKLRRENISLVESVGALEAQVITHARTVHTLNKDR